MRLMPVFSLPSVSSLTSDLHVKPCLHTSPPPLAPPTPALGQRQKEEFSRKEDKGGEGDCGIPVFISACHRDFANPSPIARRSSRVCWLGRDGKGLRERAAGFIRRLPRSPRRREARTGAAPHTGTAASHASLGGAQRCAAELQRDHNSNDHNEGDGSHLTLSHPILSRSIPSRRAPTAPPRRRNGERGGNGGAVGSRTSPARMPLAAPRRDVGM